MMKVKEIYTRVRATIDELTGNESEFADSTSSGKNLQRIIADKIMPSLMYILQNSPTEILDDAQLSGLTDAEKQGLVIDATTKAASIRLPSNALRIVTAKLSSWSQSPEPVGNNSAEYLMQQDPYARGSYDKPVTIITRRGGGTWLEMYCAKDGTDTVDITYVANPETGVQELNNEDTEINVPSRLEGAFIYHAAGLTCLTLREDIAANLLSLSKQYLGIKEQG